MTSEIEKVRKERVWIFLLYYLFDLLIEIFKGGCILLIGEIPLFVGGI